jgi:hypothetical protein
MKTILILTGPQGAGNHLWSKIFALHPDVAGWSALLDTYWIGHDQEPFADCWENPNRLKDFDWTQSDWYVTSISVPYMLNGMPTVPDLHAFVTQLQTLGMRVKFAVLGRDRNIVRLQQTRVRGLSTVGTALSQYSELISPAEQIRPFATPVFLSYELLHLYQDKYLEMIAQQLNFPMATNDARLAEILAEDTNRKYISQVEHQPTDDLAHHASRKRP